MTDLPSPPPRLDRIGRPAGPVNPFELYLLAVCALQGWAVITHVAQPPSLQTALPPALRLTWGVLLLVGGLFSVSGLYWWDPFTGIEVKRVGLVAAAAGTLAYGVAIMSYAGSTGFIGAAYNLFFAAACIVRIRQVTGALKVARGRVKAMREARDQ